MTEQNDAQVTQQEPVPSAALKALDRHMESIG